MSVTVYGVAPKSKAARARIHTGDILHTINGHPINDVLDYRFYMLEPTLVLTLTTVKGKSRRCTVRKGESEELGLEFETYLMDRQRGCTNHCIFCFIDQLPSGMRESLYFKDDDARLSFLFGNYITLTNLKDADIDRIIAMHISPINVSVHTTDPALRCRMMGNRFAGDSLRHLYRLSENGIRLNCQLVLCPGWNDGEALRRTLRDLTALPSVQSICCVPLGMTRYREGLTPLTPFDAASAAAVLDIIEPVGEHCLRERGDRLVYPADEFFVLANRPIPPYSYYGEFYQIENGVGMLASLRQEFFDALAEYPAGQGGCSCSIATGTAAYPFLCTLTAEAKKMFPQLDCRVYEIKNDFFGHSITVAGLLTGGDIGRQLAGKPLGSRLLLSENMLRQEGDRFLDDLTPQELSEALGVPVRVLPNTGGALVAALRGDE